MIREAGSFNRTISIIIKERDLINSIIMEHIHFLLTLGIIPNLYNPQDWEDMKNNSGNSEIQNMTLDVFQNYFKNNIKNNIRIFMSFSPLGEKLRHYVRTYPSIIDHTSCIAFTDWPETALKEVANKFIDMENLIIEKKPKKKKKKKKRKKKKIKKKKN